MLNPDKVYDRTNPAYKPVHLEEIMCVSVLFGGVQCWVPLDEVKNKTGTIYYVDKKTRAEA